MLGLGLVYWQVARKLVYDWANDDNYSHGFLIVPVALYFVWERRARLRATPIEPTWFGLVMFGGGIGLLLAGLLGAELFLSRVSLIFTLSGMLLFLFGWRYVRALAFPLAFLLLMIPLPAIIFNQITFPLQLLASRAGVFAIASAGIPVLREGNVIVLAHATLEVAEACSGIRSLITLITLAIVYGYIADTRTWVRLTLVLSAVPITIVANAARVAGTGMAAHWRGAEVAEGFFHGFSGWIMFIAAFALMLMIQRLLARLAPARSDYSPVNRLASSQQMTQIRSLHRIMQTRVVILLVSLFIAAGVVARADRQEEIPLRLPFSDLPLSLGEWRGHSQPPLDEEVLAVLGVDDYTTRDYVRREGSVGLFVGYWESQKQGDTIHSPQNCLPGAGWAPVSRRDLTFPDPRASATGDLTINRYLIQKGLDRQLVLYWYQSHGRVVASGTGARSFW